MQRLEINEEVIFAQDHSAKILFTKRILDAKNEDDLRTVSKKYGIDFDKITYNSQIHSDIVRVVSEDEISKVKEGDSLVTSMENVALLLFTADCVPIVFYDEVSIGASHCGWRGTYSELAEKTLKKMVELGSKVENIKVVIGPAIGVCCYEVGEDLAEKFYVLLKSRGILEESINRCIIRGDKPHLDLLEINKVLLVNAGVLPENIESLNICTSCNSDKFFSYRKDDKTPCRIGTLVVRDGL